MSIEMDVDSWIKEEVSHIRLGDDRLNKRLEILVEQLSQMPTASIPEACGSWAAMKAAYRFFDSDNVEVIDIQESIFASTLERIREEETILVAQDTTSLDFTRHKGTRGLGYIDNLVTRGIKMHSGLAINVDGVPVGLIDQKFWVRKGEEVGKRSKRKKKKTEEKESQRWLSTVENIERRIGDLSAEVVGRTRRVIIVSDRESDIFDLFAQEREEGYELLIRGAHNRRVSGEVNHLFDKMLAEAVGGEINFSVKRSRERKGRIVHAEVRFNEIEIHPPRYRGKEKLEAVRLNCIFVKEKEAPRDIQPIEWLLLTTMPVRTLEDALQYVQWYSLRWLVERYHYVLKSGCQIEELQLEEEERIERATAVYCVVAWRLLFITYLARKEPDKSSSGVVEQHEWEAIHCFINKTTSPPSSAPSISELVRRIAQLGGFPGRKGDGDPGVKVLWRGIRRLPDISEMYQIFRKDMGNA